MYCYSHENLREEGLRDFLIDVKLYSLLRALYVNDIPDFAPLTKNESLSLPLF